MGICWCQPSAGAHSIDVGSSSGKMVVEGPGDIFARSPSGSASRSSPSVAGEVLPCPVLLHRLPHEQRLAAGFVYAWSVPTPQLDWSTVAARFDDAQRTRQTVGPLKLVELHRCLDSASQSSSSSQSSNSESSMLKERLRVMVCPTHNVETVQISDTDDDECLSLTFAENLLPFYEQTLVQREHAIFFATATTTTAATSPLAASPVIATVEQRADDRSSSTVRAAIRTCYGELRVLLPGDVDVEQSLNELAEAHRDVFPLALHWRRLDAGALPVQGGATPRLRHQPLSQHLVDYDRKQRAQHCAYKVGVVNTRPGDMASGSDRSVYGHNEVSADFLDFLSIIGERVALNGFEGFRGGLDVDNDRTGTHSYRAVYRMPESNDDDTDDNGTVQLEIMFHVAALLPYAADDPQQLARKRHIGNDVVVVVFHEDPEPFDPRVFVSQMNHAFVVVKKVGQSDAGRPLYAVAYVSKGDVPPCHPLVRRERYVGDARFARWLHTKIINAENTCVGQGSAFTSRSARARKSLLEHTVRQFSAD